MTDTERWLKIAEAYLTPRGKRTEEQRGIAVTGLNYAYHAVVPASESYRVYAFTEWGCDEPFLWPLTKEYDEVRGLLACLFAAMTDEDRADIGMWGKS